MSQLGPRVAPASAAGRGLGRLLARVVGIKAGDRQNVVVGFTTLLLTMTAHAVLETARDALFLQKLPPSRLPWAYLMIALLTLAGSAFQRRVLAHVPRRRLLSLTLLAGAGVTSCFTVVGSLHDSAAALLALYVWTGVLATTVVVQFWLLASYVMDFGQAKRTFALLGGGGLLGAVIGSLLASGVLMFTTARVLPLVASGVLALASFVPLFFSRERAAQEAPLSSDSASETPARSVARGAPRDDNRSGQVRHDAYLRRVLALALLGTITVTLADYIFKSVVVREVAPARLGDFFARYYALLNGLALIVELIITPRLLRTAGVPRALQVMPFLLLCASVGFAAVGGLFMVLLLRGADGALRHSMNRVGHEILYLPLSSAVRGRIRAFTEAVGLRVGQAAGSLLILGAVALDIGPETLVLAPIGLATAWLAVSLTLEGLYVERFRRALGKMGPTRRASVPDLDVRSLEALMMALSSHDDVEVVTALDMFALHDKSKLVPALILYHPSHSVVLRALSLFSDGSRPDVQAVAERLLAHPDHRVRAAALRVYIAGSPKREALWDRREDDNAAVRTTALVGLVHVGAIARAQAAEELAAAISGPDLDTREALARALPLLPAADCAWVGTALMDKNEASVAALVAKSFAASPRRDSIPALIRLLAHREARSCARKALVALGPEALFALERVLGNAATAPEVRRHVPRTISRFEGVQPVAILEHALSLEHDDAVAFKILRGLSRIRSDHPATPVNRGLLEQIAQRMVERAAIATGWRDTVEAARHNVQVAATAGAELLSAALSDEANRSLERAFRVMHILEPTASLEAISSAIRSRDADMRARGRELVQHVAPDGIRRSIVALLDDLRLEKQESLDAESQLESLRSCLAALLEDRSRLLRAVSSHYLAELRATAERVHSAAAEATPPNSRQRLRNAH